MIKTKLYISAAHAHEEVVRAIVEGEDHEILRERFIAAEEASQAADRARIADAVAVGNPRLPKAELHQRIASAYREA